MGSMFFYGQGEVFSYHGQDVPINLDSDASLVQSDSIGPINPNCDQQGLSFLTRIEGVGRVRCSLRDFANNVCSIETCAYYIPEVNIHLIDLKCN